MLKVIKSILGPSGMKAVRPFGHGVKGALASAWFGFPATRLKIIAITGTKGKTSTTVTTGRLLNLLGYKAGYISTAVICTGKEETVNSTKMSSVDGILMQRLLQRMVNNGCEYAVIEMSSQGLEQNRQIGLYGFDAAIFLNIYPEHIEAHGSFEAYRDAKGSIFKHLKKGGIAVINGQEEFSEPVNYIKSNFIKNINNIITIDNTVYQSQTDRSSQYKSLIYNKDIYGTNFMADFEIENLAFAIVTIQNLTNDKNLPRKLPSALNKLLGIPGRLDYTVKKNTILASGVTKDLRASIDIMVDYAHETGSMEKLLANIVDWKKAGFYDKVIHIVSCDGVGRDDWKKPVLGDISQKYADYTFVTTDNYEAGDNPDQIIEMITQNYNRANLEKTYSTNINRKEAMIAALTRATKHKDEKVLIVSTGVGTEQYLTQPTGLMKWDEKMIWEMIFNNFA
jgi:UDP-N-acetylmuramoyl-L-alanyl-D-glutamate--2,6-diaminopimelate ligase